MKALYSIRLLRRAPAFTAASVLTLGLGIGLSTVVFTLYDRVALKPISAKAADELYESRTILRKNVFLTTIPCGDSSDGR
jgi:hypothetical protein